MNEFEGRIQAAENAASAQLKKAIEDNDTEGQDSQWDYGMDKETEVKYFEKFLSLVNYNDDNMVIVTSELVKS